MCRRSRRQMRKVGIELPGSHQVSLYSRTLQLSAALSTCGRLLDQFQHYSLLPFVANTLNIKRFNVIILWSSTVLEICEFADDDGQDGGQYGG